MSLDIENALKTVNGRESCWRPERKGEPSVQITWYKGKTRLQAVDGTGKFMAGSAVELPPNAFYELRDITPSLFSKGAGNSVFLRTAFKSRDTGKFEDGPSIEYGLNQDGKPFISLHKTDKTQIRSVYYTFGRDSFIADDTPDLKELAIKLKAYWERVISVYPVRCVLDPYVPQTQNGQGGGYNNNGGGRRY